MNRDRLPLGMRVSRALVALLMAAGFLSGSATTHAQAGSNANTTGRARWTEQQAHDWYAKQPWLVGSNYLPADAINQLEMWQAETFNPQRIDTELGWAEGLGMNTMRVFLHDLVWQQDSAAFTKRIDNFLAIAQKHHIRPLLVLFDSCWDPFPKLGTQHAPTLGVHNSGWVQSPGVAALGDESQRPRLEAYVKGVIGAFAKDDRILGWDLWNEPESNDGPYAAKEPPNKATIVLELLPHVFEWARSVNPAQPLTSGVYEGDWSSPVTLNAMAQVQLTQSDIITFHNYDNPAEFEMRVKWLEQYHRPIICTEYMARTNGSFFEGTMIVAKKHNVGAINWGFVAGKTQTMYPWSSWRHPYTDGEPTLWFHDIFRSDGTAYQAEEVAFIKRMTGKS